MKKLAVLVSALMLAGCGSSPTAGPPSTVTISSSGHPSRHVTELGSITLPDLTNQNAEIAYKKLQKLGLTDVQMTSANPKYTMVLAYSNWTVVGMEPAAGTSVNSDDTVILKVTKP